MPSVPKAKTNKPKSSKPTKPTPNKAAKKPKDPKYVPKKLATTVERPIVYENYGCKIYTKEKPLTAEIAKDILGWTEIGFDENPLFKDEDGKEIWCSNNIKNRPIYWNKVEANIQEILMGRWQMNGHTISIGKTRIVLNGQHRLIALVLAWQRWNKHPGQYNDYWPTDPVLETYIATGIDETPEVINTFDIGKTRTLMDAVYQSQYFSKLNKSQRKAACRAADYAVRMLWVRTGAKDASPFVKHRTITEAIDFIERHPRILEMITFVIQENNKDSLTRFHSMGYFSALLYLMATSASDRENDSKTGYIQVTNPDESCLDFTNWDEAQRFATELANGGKALGAVREVYGNFVQDYISPNERNCVLIKAWNAYIDDRDVIAEEITPVYIKDGDGYSTLNENPSVGGIDLGDTSFVAK